MGLAGVGDLSKPTASAYFLGVKITVVYFDQVEMNRVVVLKTVFIV